MSELLFQVTEDQLETGMRGYPVGYCTTSSVDPQKGLFYRGKPISEFKDSKPEEVIAFLRGGQGVTAAACSDQVIHQIYQLPREGHPMKLFASALLLLGMIEGKNDYAADQEILLSKLPHLVAAVINHHAGWGETPKPDPSQGYMGTFATMVRAPDANPETLAEIFRLFNILHYDHGGGNLSAFTGKAVASGLEDLFGSITAAMCALAGPRHGKANQDCLSFVKDVLSKLGEEATGDQVEELIRERLANKELVYGFGHAVLRVEDARASIFYDYVQNHFPSHPLVKIALHLRERGPRVLKENPKIANPYPNVDAVSGTALSASGFPYPEYYTVLFGLSRSVGISTQIIYERLHARGGKGTPIVRPKYIYRPS